MMWRRRMLRRMARPLVALAIALVIVLALFEARTSQAAGAGIKLSPAAGLPGSTVTVSGTRFKSTEFVAIIFDAPPVGPATTNGSGSFTTSVTVPAGVTPGDHVIKATGQQSSRSAQATYFVETSWPMYGFGPEHTGLNSTESVLSTSTVSRLTLDWSVSAYGIA